ncbi:MAG: hypothetical protein IKT60_03360 [Clostridia bacterium]|nr:hypothetical protein [Clostridia bacterium]
MTERALRMRRRLERGYAAIRGIEPEPQSGLSMAKLRRACAKRIFSSVPEGKWRRVQELLREELARADGESGTDKQGLFLALCAEAADPVDLCEQFHIEARTYYAWRTEILNAAMLLSTEEGCFSLRRREIR